ncbi:glycoside hydrolase family 88 protein [Colwellia sp. MEBiC06753]
MKTRIWPLLPIAALVSLMGCEQQQSVSVTSAVNSSTQTPTQATAPELVANIALQNPSQFDRPEQSYYISYYDLGLPTGQAHQLMVNADGKALASESIDSDFDGSADGLLVMTPLLAGQTLALAISKGQPLAQANKRTQAELSIKQGGQWQAHSKYPDTEFQEYVGGEFVNVEQVTPEPQYTDHSNWIRYEGPGIESDKVGYRIYLDHRNGFDIFGKLVPEPVLQQVGLDGYESYHHLQDWGMDILKVGSSLGAGGFGLWHNDALELITKVGQHTATIIENGALQSSFRIDYQNWQSSVGTQDMSATFAMRAGSHLVDVNVNLTQPIETMAAGVVKHKGTELITGNLDTNGRAYSYIASWGDQSLDGSKLGMAVFFQKSAVKEITEDEHNYIAVLKPYGNPSIDNSQAQQVHYYFAALWQPESGIATKAAFTQYLEQTAEMLTIAPRSRVTTSVTEQAIAQKSTLPLSWSKQLADSELARKGFTYHYDGWDVHRKRLPKFEYDIVGLYPYALNELASALADDKYSQALTQITGSFINDDGTIKRYKQSNFNIDAVAPGRAVLALYKQTGEEKYQKAAAILREQLVHHPKTKEGAFWHKKKYDHQLWLDGVYMGMPFLAEYALMFEQGDTQKHSLEEVVNEFVLTRKYLRDAKTGLYYHGWDEAKQQAWADKQTGLSAEFWGRGLGWLAMAVVDVLEIIPASETTLRQPLLDITAELAVALANTQDSTGTWWQILDKPNAIGNYRESSATAMFVYFYAKAISNGYISNDYLEVANNGYQGLINEFVLVHDNGEISMTNQCYVAGLGFGRDGSYNYYMREPVWQNDAKGTGPFILAGIAMAQLSN